MVGYFFIYCFIFSLFSKNEVTRSELVLCTFFFSDCKGMVETLIIFLSNVTLIFYLSSLFVSSVEQMLKLLNFLV